MGFSDIISSLFTQTPVIGGSGPLGERTIEAQRSLTRLQVPEATTQSCARGSTGKGGNDGSCGKRAEPSAEGTGKGKGDCGAGKGKGDCGAGTLVDSGGFRLGFRDWPRDAAASSGGRIRGAGACVLSLSLSLSRSLVRGVLRSLFLSFSLSPPLFLSRRCFLSLSSFSVSLFVLRIQVCLF
jgi:hypothetical protein